MALGSPVTDKFPIGTAEIRIAELAKALKHLPSDSIGCLDDVTISITNTSVQKMAGFPRRQVASAITENVVSVTGTVGEYSRRNIQTLAGEAPEPLVAEVVAGLASAAVAGATSLTLNTGEGANFAAGQLIVMYVEGRPELISIVQIDSITADTVTLKANTPTLHAYPGLLTRIFAAQPIGKSITKTEYFSIQVLQTEFSTGKPIPWNFWKGSITNGLELALNPTDFSTTSMEISMLEPAASDFQTGGQLEHVKDFILDYPIWMGAPGG